MKQNLKTAILMTVVTTVLLGLVYPLIVTGLAQLFFRNKANGQLLYRDGTLIGSRIIGQQFSGPGYLHSRPSAAGSGYDAANSGGTNFAPTNEKLISRVRADAARLQAENPNRQVPIDLVTTSASGLDPEVTPAGAEFQVPRIARERGIDPDEVRATIRKYTYGRDLGFLGELRVNVLEVNLALDGTGRSASSRAALAEPASSGSISSK
jgi:potassium-transporting ATPase KdpC subunit